MSSQYNDEQPEKADLPIELTLSDISALSNDEHPEKADSPIDTTLSGITILNKLVQP